MRLLPGALVVTFAIAVTASVFAIWPVVADAPWEDKPAVVDRTAEIRCESALDLRAAIILKGEFAFGNETGLLDYDAQLAAVQREVTRYC